MALLAALVLILKDLLAFSIGLFTFSMIGSHNNLL